MHNITTKCRVCLSGDRRMFAISNIDVQEIWEKMTNARFNSNDGIPLLACYICCAQLRKSHQMMKRALKAEELFINFIHNNLEPSQKFLLMIDSQTQELNYNYSFDTQHCLECKQYEDPAKEIKEEIAEDYEAAIEDDCEGKNKGNNCFDIKVEEESKLLTDLCFAHGNIDYAF
ncbi:hypothetical protein K1T71_014875 [Dendrolimus kikuchii]|nr:hypothetical protein K1T71_014875 [Dendrolimus kikuchii]